MSRQGYKRAKGGRRETKRGAIFRKKMKRRRRDRERMRGLEGQMKCMK